MYVYTYGYVPNTYSINVAVGIPFCDFQSNETWNVRRFFQKSQVCFVDLIHYLILAALCKKKIKVKVNTWIC